MDFSKLFHQTSKGHQVGRKPRPSADEYSGDNNAVSYKAYPGLPRIALPHVHIEGSLEKAIHHRRSRMPGNSAAFSLEDFGAFLGFGCGITSRVSGEDHEVRHYHRAQPSAGGRYPLEMYVINLIPGELDTGVYHYGPKNHALTRLFDGSLSRDACSALFTYDWVADASAVCILTGVFSRTQNKYGERGYRYMLLEAGHIGQNIQLVASAKGYAACMLGGTKDDSVETLLDIDGVNESVIYGMALARTP